MKLSTDPIVHRRRMVAVNRQFGLAQLCAWPNTPKRSRAIRLYCFWCTR